jgi:hypothetical protein
MTQTNEKRSKRQRISKRRRTIKQRGGFEYKIIVLSEDNSYETIPVVTSDSTFADNGIQGNKKIKYYAMQFSEKEIDYTSKPQFSKTNPVIIYKKVSKKQLPSPSPSPSKHSSH